MERGDGGGAGMGQRGVVPSSSAAMLGPEMHLAHPPQPQMHAASAFHQQPEQHHGGGFQLHQPAPVRQQQPPPSSYAPYSAASSRGVKAGGHDEEEMGNGAGRGGGAVQQQQQQSAEAGAAGCQWSRMKWTDGMVRLLITVVYNAGDDGEGVSGGGGRSVASHGKAGASAAAHGHGHGHGQAAAQQKKGKWKSVSRAMMENGFMVSPQQCEDKFNDLNKRYKRVVDLLGRGKACKVVENPALLDAMDELMPKAKEEARKLLSSKHLFFREMCNYHNSGTVAASHSAGEGAAACFHHPLPAPMAGLAVSSAAHQVAAAPSMGMTNSSTRAEEEEDDDSEDVPTSNEIDEEDEDDYDRDEELAPGIKHRGGGHIDISHRFRHHNNGSHKRRLGDSSATAAGEDEEEDWNKRARRTTTASEGPTAVKQLQWELAAAAATAGSDLQQVRKWMRRRAAELEEEQVAYECRAYQLERQRLKWERFRANKERDMERARLRNDRLRIDGRRMLLVLRQKDLDLDIAEANSSVDHHPTAAAAHTPPLAAFQQQHQLGSSPSAAGRHN